MLERCYEIIGFIVSYMVNVERKYIYVVGAGFVSAQ